MPISGTELGIAVGLIALIALGLLLLRGLCRVCGEYPIVGLTLSLIFLGWMAQNPDSLDSLLPETGTEVLAQSTALDDAHAASSAHSNLSDEELIDDYLQQNRRYARDVHATPGKALRTVGL